MKASLLPAALLVAGLAGPAAATQHEHEMTPEGTSPATAGLPSCAPAGDVVAVAAIDLRFDKDCLAVEADKPFTLSFDNQEALDHNVEILPRHGSDDPLFTGKIFKGPKTVAYPVSALPAGTYHFHCELHPVTMVGTFIAAGPAGTAGGGPPGRAGGADRGPDPLVLLLGVAGVAIAVGGIAFVTGAEYGRSRAGAGREVVSRSGA